MRTISIIVICILLICTIGNSQSDYYLVDSTKKLSQQDCSKFCSQSVKKCKRLEQALKKSTDKALKKYFEVEEHMLLQLCNANESHAESLLKTSTYARNRFEDNVKRSATKDLKTENPTLKTLDDFERSVSSPVLSNQIFGTDEDNSPCECVGLEDLKKAKHDLKIELKRAELAKDFIHERNVYLQSVYSPYSNLNVDIRALEKLDFYFHQSMAERLSIFSDLTNFETRVFEILPRQLLAMEVTQNSLNTSIGKGVPMVGDQPMKDFISKLNSLIEKESYSKEKLSGVKNELYNNLDTPPTQNLSDSITSNELFTKEQLKEQPDSSVKSKSTKEVWKPNPLKGKRFRDRLIYGSSLQPLRGNGILPSRVDLSGQIGYQVISKMSLSIAIAHSVLIPIEKLFVKEKPMESLASRSYDIRAICDWQIRKNFYFQGSYEIKSIFQNYNRLNSPFSNNNSNYPTFLFGLKLKTPLGKRSNQTIELLYDFFHKKNQSQAVVIRFGMDFTPKHAFKSI